MGLSKLIIFVCNDVMYYCPFYLFVCLKLIDMCGELVLVKKKNTLKLCILFLSNVFCDMHNTFLEFLIISNRDKTTLHISDEM